MKISYNWLKDYLEFDLSTEETAEKLTLLGLEVEEIEKIGSDLEGVVVGEVTECTDHPNADRLRLCQVDVGSETVQIVCGAPNVAKGQKVPVATVGTELPVKLDNGKNLVIRKAKLRGEKSSGMICAEDELGLGDDHEGIMVLDDELKPGTPFKDVHNLVNDTVFDIGLTPNRPDASCHLGVARDLAAVLNGTLKKPFDGEPETAEPLDEHISIDIQNPDKCHRYVAKMIKDVKIQESPQWLKNKLLAIGLRPRNNVVDVTNFVLHELGQPLHAFDYDTLKGHKIIVRDYDQDRKFITLDDEERTVPAGSLFICDDEGPVALAGVMGGQNSEISDATTNVLLESAYFEPGGIRKTSKALALQTDSSYRFERGIDPNISRIAAERAAQLIAELSGGTIVDGCTDAHPVETEPIELKLRTSYLNKLLGTKFTTEEAADILNRLELEVLSQDENALTCRIPTFRPDLTREVDLIEEVGRVYDYNNIDAPEFVRFPQPQPRTFHEQLKNRVREAVKSLRFKEIYTNSLLPEEEALQFGSEEELVHTLNPTSQDMAVLRPTLAHGFLKSVAHNFNRKVESMRFFEVGHTFRHSDQGTFIEGYEEETHLLLGLAGNRSGEHWKTQPESFDFFDLKSTLEALLRQLQLDIRLREQQGEDGSLIYIADGEEIGRAFEVNSDLLERYEIKLPTYMAEFSLTRIERLLEGEAETRFRPIPKFPTFEFDLAMVVDSTVPAGDLMRSIRETVGDQLNSIQIFDVFEGKSIGEGKKSIAFRLRFLDANKTLTIKDVEPIINKVLKKLEQQHSAQLRQ